MSDKPVINLNNAAAHRLAMIIASPGLLTAPDQLYAIGAFAEAHLCNLVAMPEAPTRDDKQSALIAFDKAMDAWGRQSVAPIETTIKRRNALKALVKAASEKGALSGNLADRTLIKALELAGDE